MSDLTEFLLARIAVDERLAGAHHTVLCRRIACETCMFDDDPSAIAQERVCNCGTPARVLAECEAKRRIVERASRPVYRRTFDPAEPPTPFAELTFSGGRVYADPYREVDVTEAYQREVAAHSEPVDPATLRDLAAVYSDHPDYREEWRP